MSCTIKKTSLAFRESTTTAEHVHERTTFTQFVGHVDVRAIFEAFVEVTTFGCSEIDES
jgi:hypothetical protein